MRAGTNLALVAALGLAGCSPSGGGGSDGLRVVREDHDRDGKPDRWLHYRGRELVAKDLDLNYDGKADARLEFKTVLDRRGRQVAEVSEARDTDHDGRHDRWKVTRDGRLVARSEDRSGKGHPDYEERFTPGGRLAGIAYDRSGDGRLDIAKQLGERGEARSILYDEDHDGDFDTTAHLKGGRLSVLETGGKTLSPGDLYRTRGVDGEIAGFLTDASGAVHIRMKLRNTASEAVTLPVRPAEVEFHMRGTGGGHRMSISADVPRAPRKEVRLAPGREATVTFPVDFRLPEGRFRIRASVSYRWDEAAPLGWVGRVVTGETDFDGRVGKLR